jgi:hypothetical protein
MQNTSLARRSLPLFVIGAALALGGCMPQVASGGCKKISDGQLQVGAGSTCQFRYDQGDVARYVVVVTQPPRQGQAVSKGKFLTYAAKPGFKGEDVMKIRVERRGVAGNVQWQDVNVKVKVGPA